MGFQGDNACRLDAQACQRVQRARSDRLSLSELRARLIKRSSSFTAPAVADPVLSLFDVKRVLFQKITEQREELRKAFQPLDTSHRGTVSQGALRRDVSTFLLPLTREQFRLVPAQVQSVQRPRITSLERGSRGQERAP